MPHSFLRGRWLRMMSIGIVSSLLIASLEAAEEPDSVDASSGRSAVRESEFEDHGSYPGLTFVKAGASSSAVRKQAIADLQLDRLSPDAQKKSQTVIKNLGMFRRLPTISFECDPEVYNYFLTNPDVAVSTWRAMEISQFQLHETGPNRYHADAGDGSVGEVELFLHTPTETIIHCDGAFKSPLLPKPIIARSLMRLQTTFAKDQDGRLIGTHSGEVFVEFPSQAVEAVARVIAPVSHSIADRNFKQMTLFVHLMSQAMAKHPGWIEVTGSKLDGISKQRKQEFLDVAARSYTDCRKRSAVANGMKPLSPDEALTPFRNWNTQEGALGSSQISAGAKNTRPVQSANSAGAATLRD